MCPFCGNPVFSQYECHGWHYVADCCRWGQMMADGGIDEETARVSKGNMEAEELEHEQWLDTVQHEVDGADIPF